MAGNPAKVIKYRFDEETVARFLTAKWWDRDMAVIEKLPLNDVQESLRILEA
ncbi:hypothetical protein [Sinorhizobium medicae]|uniref:hypothetical protein n=1 Tax=Sinorhizobium medicae TaxID=110321 RepID=UPI0018770465|nr:hypothetical protein [Sinorhizobium medicae]